MKYRENVRNRVDKLQNEVERDNLLPYVALRSDTNVIRIFSSFKTHLHSCRRFLSISYDLS